MSFYWECLGQRYPFNPNKNYLIYYKGCFCPPHRGHFNTVKEFTDLGENVSVMVHQKGSPSRHGVPRNYNRKIWKMYIRELLPRHRVHLIQYEDGDDIFDLSVLDKIDTVIYIRGNEGQNIKRTQENDLYAYRRIMRKLARRNISMDFIYMDRPLVKVLSATVLTENLIQARRRCRKRNCECTYDKLKRFFPEGLSQDTAMRIIHSLQQEDLRV